MAEREYTIVFSTVNSKDSADKIAETLVAEKLAACVNVVGPMSSVYWWEGKIEKSEEYLLIIKSRRDLLDALMRRLKEVHPYKVPEILAVKVDRGNEDYLAWIDESVRHG